MPILRYTEGAVTVTLNEGLDRFVRQALEAAGGETLRILESLAGGVAADAARDWYAPGTGVTRRTGETGRTDVVETVSVDEVRVSVGSTALDRAKYVHRPGRLSTATEEITRDEYDREKARGGAAARMVFRARRDRADEVKAGKCYRIVHNPKASDGKYLLSELVTKPAKSKINAALPDIGRAIAGKAGGA